MAVVVGLYGKLPTHGDFVRRALPPNFVTPWDAWLQAGMAAAGPALDGWADAPAWRFALPAGACGPEAAAGVLLPSADAVGRRFPLTVAALADQEPAWPAPWFAAMEGAARAARDDGLDADALAALLPQPALTAGDGASLGWWTAADDDGGPGLTWPLPTLPEPAEFALLLVPP